MELANKYKSLLQQYEICTPLRLAHFFAQIHHESNLKPVEENLNYSVSSLRKVFSKYFPTDYLAKEYARQPEKIANKVYASRMGNSDEKSGDGWKYRGRGFIQITGKDNYKGLKKDLKIDYVNNPNFLLTEADSMVAAVWYWTKNNLNKYADQDDIKNVTRRINGGYNGLNHRKLLLDKYKEIFKIV